MSSLVLLYFGVAKSADFKNTQGRSKYFEIILEDFGVANAKFGFMWITNELTIVKRCENFYCGA